MVTLPVGHVRGNVGSAVVCDMAIHVSTAGMLPGFFSIIVSVESRKRCMDKLELVNSLNPYMKF